MNEKCYLVKNLFLNGISLNLLTIFQCLQNISHFMGRESYAHILKHHLHICQGERAVINMVLQIEISK